MFGARQINGNINVVSRVSQINKRMKINKIFTWGKIKTIQLVLW